MIELKVLCDNYVKQRGFCGELGLSLYIKFRGLNILFDAGQSAAFAANAALAGADLAETGKFVLSHGHFDHSDGLKKFLSLNKVAPLYLRPQALEDKYVVDGNDSFYAGIGAAVRACGNFQRRVVHTAVLQEIARDVFTVSGFSVNASGFEPAAADLRGPRLLADTFQDEQVLVIRDGGLHIFCGCAHPGICGMLDKIQGDFPGERLETLTGGLHLHDCTGERLQKTIAYLRASGIRRIVPLHCTGMAESVQLKQGLPQQVQLAYCGAELMIDRQ